MNFSREKCYSHYSCILCFTKVSTHVKQKTNKKEKCCASLQNLQHLFSLTDFRVSKYMNTRLLKTTETSTAMVWQKICLDTENLTDSNHREVTGYILDTLKQKLMYPKCKCIVDPDEIVICCSCNTMTTLDCCEKKSDAAFSVQVGISKLALSIQPDILMVAFGVPFRWKIQIS